MSLALLGAGRSGAAGVSYESEATALFARMSSAPDDTRKGHINTLIAALKAAGVWSKLDALYVFAAHDSQAALLNWKGATYDATATNSPTFTTDRGFTGASTKYIATGFNPSTGGTQHAQDSASFGVWSRSETTSIGVAMGSSGAYIYPRNGSDQAFYRVHQGGDVTVNSVTTAIGLFHANRSGASAIQLRRNGSSINTATNASTTPVNHSFKVLANAAGGEAWGGQASAAFIGASLDGTEAAALYNALAAYMTAVGA